MYAMKTATIQSAAPRLRLTPKRPARRGGEGRRPQLRVLSSPAPADRPVLLAGGDRGARDAVRRDLAGTMASSTPFEQVGAIWEVLVRAPDASMVIISGDLEDNVPAASLMQILAHRHPSLPVVSLDETPSASALSKASAAG
jgi:hypothetical protein